MHKQWFLYIILFSLSLQAQIMHPNFLLLDADSVNVLQSGNAVSTMQTCGTCHDTKYIAENNFHSHVGMGQKPASGRVWDSSTGLYGRWNPLVYRYLTPKGDEQLDLGTADWIKLFGARHVGGGPAELAFNGESLLQNPQHLDYRESHSMNAETGEVSPWNWQKSGVVELNCFLCHLENPDNNARIAALQEGQFGWANTATLGNTAVVKKSGNRWTYNRQAFSGGMLQQSVVRIVDPKSENCGVCHGLIQSDRDDPLVSRGCQPDQWTTETTGQIISPQRISDSGMNHAGKADIYRSWDVHAERVVDCSSCHYSLNNPLYYHEADETRPEHLIFSARRMEISDYLYRPDHNFARGNSSYEKLAPRLTSTMRRCESCHDFSVNHEWLPYKERHTNAVTCESCHIPQMYAPARRVFDWTILFNDEKPRIECRGFDGEPGKIETLVTGYDPVLLPRKEADGSARLAPFNMITFYYWTAGDPERPVRLIDLKKAYFENDKFHPDVVKALDENHDGSLEKAELILNTDAKVKVIRKRLESIGVKNPKISSEVQPFGIHHNVTHGEWVTKDCQTCHARSADMTADFLLAEQTPAGAMLPAIVADANVIQAGQIQHVGAKLVYSPHVRDIGFYILGHDRVMAVQVIGALAVILVLIGVSVHGGLRVIASKKFAKHETGEMQNVEMYKSYERFWHWLQALAIIGLTITGLVIHAPDIFVLMPFYVAVWIHNVLAAILVLNAFLALFYHLTSGQIHQYIPEPKGFFSQAVQQTIYYTFGIFKNEPHPFEKTRQKKLNPLQKITYLVILNILLPVQIITGILIWGAQHWPQFMSKIGGLTVIIPIHSLIAWFFAAFMLLHIYLTTTGHTPLANIKAMITGWEEINVSKENS